MRANKLIKQYFKKCWSCNGKLRISGKAKYSFVLSCFKCNFASIRHINSINTKWVNIQVDNLLFIFYNYEAKIFYFSKHQYYEDNIIDKQNFNSRLKGLKYFYNFYKKFKQNEVFL